jgi:hypothetical protein
MPAMRSRRPDRLARLACHGPCRPDPPRRAHHDRLLRVETDPDVVLDLFEMAVTWSELEYPAESTIPPARWTEFAGEHRWRDPDHVLRIFGLATDVALRAVPPVTVVPLGMAAGSGLCPALDPGPRRPRVAGG